MTPERNQSSDHNTSSDRNTSSDHNTSSEQNTSSEHNITLEQFIALLDHFDAENPEMHMISDPEIAQEYELYKLALHAIQYKAITDAVQKVRKERGDATTAAPTAVVRSMPLMQRIRKNAMKIAAVLILVIGVGAAVVKYLSTTPASIEQKYYTSYELGITRGLVTKDALDEAYKAKNWATVVTVFQSREPKAAKDYFLAGMAYMEQKQYTRALILFNILMTNNSKNHTQLFQDEAEYYAAMGYLATDQMAPARRLLDKMEADPDHLYHREVSEMNGLESLILRAK